MTCAKERSVTVCGTRGGLSNAVEHTWALILSHVRNLAIEEKNVRSGAWQTTIGRDLFGSTIGLVGLGRTGTRMARVARAFDMNILAWSPHLTPEVAETHGVTAVSKDRLFSESDIVSVHLQLSDSTRGIIGAADIARMKKTALFVNTSRGALVDEAALENAVRAGAIAGAALDVFANEPLPADSSMRSLPNSVLTPHVGYVTEGLYRRFFSDIVEDIAMHLTGTPIRVLNN
jgi:phosphoglycerate dehydrogenase-like enzyme